MNARIFRSHPLARTAAASLSALALVPFALVACSDGGGSPTAAATSRIVLESATLVVAGQVVNGMTLSRGHGGGTSTRFEARLTDAAGAPSADHTVRMRYQRPASMNGMGASGTMVLYDDGTHGDRVAGDGTYCYEDLAGEVGCHGQQAPMGQYHYEFWGEDHDGGQSNHLSVTVTLG